MAADDSACWLPLKTACGFFFFFFFFFVVVELRFEDTDRGLVMASLSAVFEGTDDLRP